MSLSKYYKDITEKNFKILTLSACFLADLTAAIYVYLLVNDKNYFTKFLDAVQSEMRTQNPDFKMMVDPTFQAQLWKVVLTTTLSMIMIFMVIHGIFYFFAYREKKFAINYVNFYIWSVAVLYTLFGLLNIASPLVVIIFPGLLALYVALGFNQKKKAE